MNIYINYKNKIIGWKFNINYWSKILIMIGNININCWGKI